MGIKISPNALLTSLLVAAGAFAAGTVNGLLGTGGGIILTLIFSRILPSTKDAFVSAMATVLPVSVISLFTYGEAARLSLGTLAALTLPSAAGGLLGAYLSTRVKAVTLEVVFAVLVIYAGGRMIFC